MKRIAVFGATGQAGRLICRLLLEMENIEVLACSRTPEKLSRFRASLGYSESRLTTRAVDLHRTANVESVLDDADLVVGATSQWQDGAALAAMAVESSTHYCGIYLSNPGKWSRLRALQSTSLDRGVMIVDDCGIHPGLPAAMVRWMARRTPLHSAWVGGKFDLEWNRLDLARETVNDFVSEIGSADPSVFVDGRWKRGYRFTRRFEFRSGQGPETCTPMLLEEMRELAQEGIVASTGFFIAGFGPVIDYGIIPLSMALSKINQPASKKVLWWGLRRYASRPAFAAVQLEAEREEGAGPVRMEVSHDDPYFLTATSVVATTQQMLAAPKAGVWTQAAFLEPDAFFESLQGMGIRVSSQM